MFPKIMLLLICKHTYKNNRLCIDSIGNIRVDSNEPENLLSCCSTDNHGGAVLCCEKYCPWKTSAFASLHPQALCKICERRLFGEHISPLEIGHPIKVQISNTLSVLEQCNPGFVEVMIISVSIVFAL